MRKPIVALHSTGKDSFLDEEGFFTVDEPLYVFRYKSGILSINDKKIKTKKPFLFLEKIINKEGLYAVGFVSYEFKRYTLSAVSLKREELPIPEVYFVLFKSLERKFTFKNIPSSIKKVHYPEKQFFIKSVNKALNYIQQGDIYQINLSDRICLKGSFNIERIFFNLTEVQPAPYMLFIRDRDFSVISASMELFLRKKGEIIETKPIKGTRPRGKNQSEDKLLLNELKTSEKERAENLMITDLMRNDLGRIAKTGSVRVKELFKVEKYKTLYQMHSTVEAKIKEGLNLQQILESTFPPGSVTGAPKKRAVQIIDELERYKRYVYCGAHFLITPELDFVSSVAIRQSIFIKDRCYIYVGAGIVADSIPEKEYEEILLKAKANLKSIEI